MRRILVAALTVAIAATACGDQPVARAVPDGPMRYATLGETISDAQARLSDPEPLDEPLIGCPSGPSFPLSAIDSVEPLATSGRPDLIAAYDSFLSSEEGVHWAQDNWQILWEYNGEVGIVHAAPGALAFMTAEQLGAGWRWTGSSSGGDCPLQTQLPAGVGLVVWDVVGKPTAESTTIELRANERDCASGQAMGDRFREPDVTETETEIVITLSVTPPFGGQDCQGNPDLHLTIELSQPVGERDIVDGLDLGIDLGEHLRDMAANE